MFSGLKENVSLALCLGLLSTITAIINKHTASNLMTQVKRSSTDRHLVRGEAEAGFSRANGCKSHWPQNSRLHLFWHSILINYLHVLKHQHFSTQSRPSKPPSQLTSLCLENVLTHVDKVKASLCPEAVTGKKRSL